MPAYVALLRGINVGGRAMVAMSDLRELGAALGFTGVRTLLQSGNLIFFACSRRTGAALERLLEAETEKRLGVTVEYFVRSAAELNLLLAANPFPEAAERDPSHLLVIFHKDPPGPSKVAALQTAIRGREAVCADGKHLYVVYPDGIATSKLTSNLIEKSLGCRGTGRNWNTVRKLAALAAE
jgi:uncharacterized protein (DUF1697 family)